MNKWKSQYRILIKEDIIYTKIRSVKNKEQWIYIDKYNWEPQKEKE